MYCDIPKFIRCCFCLPLRYGVLVYGYLNLMVSAFLIILFIWIFSQAKGSKTVPMIMRGASIEVHVTVLYVVYSVDILFNVMLIIGAHKKNIGLIRIYYYYGIVTFVSTFLCFAIYMSTIIVSLTVAAVLESAVAFCGFVLHGYSLLVIRSEMQKLNLSTVTQYTNPTELLLKDTV